MQNNLFTAIIFLKDETFRKYRNIKNFSKFENEFYNTNFIDFLKKINAQTCNLYEKETKKFYKQIKL